MRGGLGSARRGGPEMTGGAGGGFAQEGGGVGEGMLERDGGIDDGEGPIVEPAGEAFLDGAGEREDGLAGFAGESRDAAGAFAIEGLRIKPTFAGDDEVGGGDLFHEADGF